jgi:succinoglycan biosynthesis protein ExoM
MLISICVATYRRPEGLKRLIAGLDRLIFLDREQPRIEVIVVDNDPTCSARAFCKQLQSQFKWSIKYFSEPQRGISYVRNKAVAEVATNADFMLFIDDDEVPEPDWIEQLLIVQQEYDADVVAGPSLPFFPEPDLPKWVTSGHFFEPQRYPTGYRLKYAGTNNVLVRARILREMDRVFDERFALTGGEDSHLFMRLDRAGYKLVWADLAVVYEWVPKSRTNVKWILQRGYRCYGTYSLCEKELEPLLKVLVKRISTGTGRIAIGIVSLLPALFLGKAQSVQALLQISRGAGILSGLIGKSYNEYQNTHGD